MGITVRSLSDSAPTVARDLSSISSRRPKLMTDIFESAALGIVVSVRSAPRIQVERMPMVSTVPASLPHWQKSPTRMDLSANRLRPPIRFSMVGCAAKAGLAREHGCAETVLSTAPDFVRKVREFCGGGVAVVYDSVGRDTFFQSLDCLRRHGTMVSFGNASGPVEPFSPMELAKRGSLHLTRPSLFDFIASKADLEAGAAELFGVINSGAVKIEIGQRYPLKDVAQAHRDLESRKTTGSSVLLP